MKQKLRTIIPLIAVCLLVYLTYIVINKIKYKNEVANMLKNIPEFSFKTLENKNFQNHDLDLTTPTIIIYFNSECDVCHNEMQIIKENTELFNEIELLFVSTEAPAIIKKFANQYNLLTQRNFTFLNDSTHTFSDRFDAHSIPFILIYDKNQKLVKKHKGQLEPKEILKILYPITSEVN